MTSCSSFWSGDVEQERAGNAVATGATHVFVSGLGGANIYDLAPVPHPNSVFRYNASHGALILDAAEDGTVRARFVATRVDDLQESSLPDAASRPLGTIVFDKTIDPATPTRRARNSNALSSVRVAVTGDIGNSLPSTVSVASLIASYTPDEVVLNGDLIYPREPRPSLTRNVGRSYGGFLAPCDNMYCDPALLPNRVNRLWPVLGDNDWEGCGADLDSWFELFPFLERNETSPERKRYYATDFGRGSDGRPLMRALMMSCVSDYEKQYGDGVSRDSIQGRWVLREIERAPEDIPIVAFCAAAVMHSGRKHPYEHELAWLTTLERLSIVVFGDEHIFEYLSVPKTRAPAQRLSPVPEPEPESRSPEPEPRDVGFPCRVDNFCRFGPRTHGCEMTFPGGYCDPNGNGGFEDADWTRGALEHQAACEFTVTNNTSCACSVNNLCQYGPNTAYLEMTWPGGYCDPDANGSFDDADWVRGFHEFQSLCHTGG